MQPSNLHSGAFNKILQKRSHKLKSYKSSQSPTTKLETPSPRKVAVKQKDDDFNMFLTNMYYYFINDASKLDEMHLVQSDQAQAFEFKNIQTTEDFLYEELDYLTEVEIREIKGNYKDYMIGDYLMVFPNPDHIKKDRPVYYREALEVYDQALTSKSQENLSKVQLVKEKLAFIRAFNSLDDYVKENEGDDSEEEEEFEDESPLKRDDKHKKASVLGKMFMKKEKKQNKKSFFSFFSRKKKTTMNEDLKTPGDFTERKTLKRNPTIMLSEAEENLLKKTTFENEEDFKDLKELKLVFKKMRRIKNVRKKFCKAGFLEKKAFERKDAGFDYQCKNSPAKDFLTLVRNIILVKLTMLAKMHTRLFLCSTGKDVLMVLKCDEDVLKKHADSIGTSKQMELGACDLMSLEPVDRRFRPLRIKNFMKMDDLEYNEYVQERMKKKKISKKEEKEEKEENNENFKEMNDFFDKLLLDHDGDLQTNCKEIYKKIKDINEEHLRDLLVTKNEKINSHLKKLVKDYKIELPDTVTDIQNDCDITKKEWLGYFMYLCYLQKYFDLLMNKMKDNKLVKDNILFLLKLILRKAVGDSNEIHDDFNKGNFFLKLLGVQKKKSLLKTIWSYLNMDPSPPFSKFFLSSKSKAQKKETNKEHSALRKEKKQLETDKSKEIIEISEKLSKNEEKHLEDSMKKRKKEKISDNETEKTEKNLWRTYEINEDGERSIFLNMEKMKLINDIILKNFNMVYLMKQQYIDSYFPLHNYYELNLSTYDSFFKKLENADIVEPKIKKKDYEQLYKLFMDLSDEAENTDFNSDGSCLEKETQLNWKWPWYLSIETMRNYFGEKIAIYFSFLSFYTLEMCPMAILGLIAQILIYADAQSDAAKLSFSILIIVWSTTFIEMWKRRQAMFAVKYGQLDFQEEEAERPDFKGEYTRSIVDDNYNLTYFNSSKKKLKMVFSFFVSLLMITLVIFCVYGIFTIKSQAYCYQVIDGQCIEIDNNSIIQILLTLLNTIQIVIFNIIYGGLALKLNNFENHKLFSSYENSLVLKIFFFNFVNTFFSLVFIAFFNPVFPNLNLCKINNSCYDSLSHQMMIIFLTFFANNVVEVLTPFIMILVNIHMAKKSDTIFNSNKYLLFGIDQEIEKDYMKTNYFPSLEIDGTVEDYMEMAMQFGFLNLFGMSFPLAFTLAFLNDIAEIQVDKMKLVRFKRRPIPKGAANIGTWLVILDLISFLAIFSNTGIIILTADVAGNSSISTIFLFVVLLLMFLGLKYVIRFLIPDIPEKADILSQRHGYVIEKCNWELEINKNVNYIPCNGTTIIENVVPINKDTDMGPSSSNPVTSSNPTEGVGKDKKTIQLKAVSIDKIKLN